jgi:hypothetical protein
VEVVTSACATASERTEVAASAWDVESKRVVACSSASAPVPGPHHALLLQILGIRTRA